MKITLALLRKHYACPAQRAIFARTFPAGAEPTLRNLKIAQAAKLDVLWCVNLLPAPLWAEYLAKTAPLRAEYDAKIAPLRAEYYAKRAMLWAEYKAKTAPLRAEYDAKTARILIKYLREMP